jgi:hypothetical protein
MEKAGDNKRQTAPDMETSEGVAELKQEHGRPEGAR